MVLLFGMFAKQIMSAFIARPNNVFIEQYILIIMVLLLYIGVRSSILSKKSEYWVPIENDYPFSNVESG